MAKHQLLSLAFAAVAVAVSSCASAPSNSSDGGNVTIPDGGMCKPGDTKNCACLGATAAGKRTCSASGIYGDCQPCDGTSGMGGTPTDPGNTTPGKCGACDGCCNGTTCVTLANETDSQCGPKGKICTKCSGSSMCDNDTGKCTGAASGGCAQSCDGCCSAKNGCVTFQDTDYSACGVNGSSCAKCPVVGGLCSDAGMCSNQIAYYETYEISVRVINANMYGCSVAAGGEINPDPFVCMYAWDATNKQIIKDFDGNPVSGCTKNCTSMGLCNLSVNDGIIRRASDGVPVEFPGDTLTMGQIIVQVNDYDTGFLSTPDLMGQGALPVVSTLNPGAQLMGGPYSTTFIPDCNVPITYQVEYQF